jgi:hypothetical protein
MALSQAQFIEKAQKVYGDRYDYSPTVYVHSQSKLTICCPQHGLFEKTPNNYLRGSECPLCQSNSASDTRTFIIKAQETHGQKYDYSQVDYVNHRANVTIICAQHGPFQQSPSNHYKGAGCPKCANKFRGGTQHFIDRARRIHGDKYDYSQVAYKARHTNTTIVCSKHGLFQQTPHNHLAGKGCAKCAKEGPGGAWKADSWASRQAGRLALLYVVRLSDNEESFYKVGITLCSIKKRLKTSRFPYQIEVIATFASSDAIAIHQAESAVKKRFKALRYLPNKPFAGRTECYTDISPILEFFATQVTIQKAE